MAEEFAIYLWKTPYFYFKDGNLADDYDGHNILMNFYIRQLSSTSPHVLKL